MRASASVRRYTGADIGAVVREASLAALEQDISTSHVAMRHFEAALGVSTPNKIRPVLASIVSCTCESGPPSARRLRESIVEAIRAASCASCQPLFASAQAVKCRTAVTDAEVAIYMAFER